MSISIVMLRGLCAELEKRGIASQRLLDEIQVDAQRLRAAGNLSLDEFGAALHSATRLTGDESLGLALGANAPEHMLQLVGHLLLAADTMREAFELFSRYSSLIASGFTYSLEERGELAYFRMTFDPNVLGRQGARFASEFCMTMALRIGQHFAPGAAPNEVSFMHDAPAYQHRYARVFHCAVHCQRPSNVLVFSRALLDKRNVHGDESMRAFLRDAAEQMVDRVQRRLSTGDRLRALLRSQPDGWDQDAELIARKLGLTRRSLGRRLRLEGLTLIGIIEEERCRAACRQLARPGGCIKDIAERLGYSEPSAFHRAFKRWTGRTPAQFMRAPHVVRNDHAA